MQQADAHIKKNNSGDLEKTSILPNYCRDVPGITIEELQKLANMKPRQRKKMFASLGKEGDAKVLCSILKTASEIGYGFSDEIREAQNTALERRHTDAICVLLHYQTSPEFAPVRNIVKYFRDKAVPAEQKKILLTGLVEAGLDLDSHIHIHALIMPMFKQYATYDSNSPAKDLLVHMFHLGLDNNALKRACLNRDETKAANLVGNKYCEFLEGQKQSALQPSNAQLEIINSDVDINVELESAEEAPWIKVSDNSIAFIEKIEPTETTFQTIFNFEACNIKTLAQIGSAQPAMEVQSFTTLIDTDFLQTAFNKLCELGGNPKPFQAENIETKKGKVLSLSPVNTKQMHNNVK